jgi:putative membrane protein
MTGQNPFPQPTRQSSVAIIFILGNVFRLLIRQLWVVILIVIFNPKKSQGFSGWTLFFIGLAGFGAITSIINYFNYFFYIRDGELHMEKGVFRKIKVNVPLDRIQTVNFKQNILHQAFNVVAVDIDTAGSSGNEFSLQAISMERAEALRKFVDQFRVAEKTGDVETEEITEAGAVHSSSLTPHPSQTLLFQLSPLDLLKIGVSQNHLRTAGIIMAFFLGFADDVEEALDLNFSKKMEEWLGTAEGMDILYYLLLGLPFLLIASFLITLVRTALQHFDLKFWRTERGFKIVSGLFTRQEVSANLRKIQFVRWSSSPLMRLFDMMAVQLPQAASVQVSRKLSVSLPGCYEPQLDAVREAYFPEEKQLEHEEHGVDKRIIRRQFFLTGILPVAALMLVTRSLLGNSIWIWALWLPVAFWLSVQYYQRWHWYVSEEGIRAAWGVVNQTSVLLQWYKVQGVALRQSIFLRRVGLAHIVLYTAAGAVSVPYIPLAKAQAVRDFVLYKIETDGRAWM